MVPNLTGSVSMAADGKLHATLTNLSLEDAADIEGVFADCRVKSVSGTILTGSMKAHNTFDAPDEVHTQAFAADITADNSVAFRLPPCSVLHLEIELA